MRWARNRSLGIDIEAADARQWPGAFCCPLCERPVVVRDGPLVPAYFAHRRGEGTTECENYHPPAGYRLRFGVGSDFRQASRPAQELAFLAIRGQTPSEAELLLRIPKAECHDEWSGALTVDTGLGEVSITHDIAARGWWISVAPMGEYRVATSGIVDPRYAMAFLDAQLTIRSGGSMFRYGETVQRQLNSREQLCWGDSYWLIAHRDDFRLTGAPSAIDLFVSDLRTPWVIVLVVLPPSDLISAENMLAVERWLGRAIRTGRDTFHFVDPLPHHFDAEGFPVFPCSVDTIRFKCPSEARLQVAKPTGEPAEVRLDSLSDSCELKIDQPGQWQFRTDGLTAGHISVQECAFLTTPSITLTCADQLAACPSIAAERLLNTAAENTRKVDLRVTHEHLCRLISVNGQSWPQGIGLSWNICNLASSHNLIEVRGIGSVGQWPEEVGDKRDKLEELESRCAWLWGVAATATSHAATVAIRLPEGPLPDSVRRLESRRWDRRFTAHVRELEFELAERRR
jgi:hypothetical protein